MSIFLKSLPFIKGSLVGNLLTVLVVYAAAAGIVGS
jgi:hypothetical protein